MRHPQLDEECRRDGCGDEESATLIESIALQCNVA
jgi:hypothetical protein